MQHDETLRHTKWECKYHVVFIPKYRRKALYTELRHHLGEVEVLQFRSGYASLRQSSEPDVRSVSAEHL